MQSMIHSKVTLPKKVTSMREASVKDRWKVSSVKLKSLLIVTEGVVNGIKTESSKSECRVKKPTTEKLLTIPKKKTCLGEKMTWICSKGRKSTCTNKMKVIANMR